MDKTASRGRSSQFRSPESVTGFEFDEEAAEEDDDGGGFGGKGSIALKN